MARKLYQHLAVVTSAKQAFEKIVKETKKVFEGVSLFEGFNRTYEMLNEDEVGFPTESKEVATTVHDKLLWTKKFVADVLDAELQRDAANCAAFADLVVDGVTIAKDLPAQFLLTLERKVSEMISYHNGIPTLDPSLKWEASTILNVYKHGPIVKHRTTKKTVPVLLHPGTAQHPPKVEAVTEDVVIAKINTTSFSGAVHPLQKAKWLERLEKLNSAVKVARLQANVVDVPDKKIGEALFNWVYKEDL